MMKEDIRLASFIFLVIFLTLVIPNLLQEILQ